MRRGGGRETSLESLYTIPHISLDTLEGRTLPTVSGNIVLMPVILSDIGSKYLEGGGGGNSL